MYDVLWDRSDWWVSDYKSNGNGAFIIYSCTKCDDEEGTLIMLDKNGVARDRNGELFFE